MNQKTTPPSPSQVLLGAFVVLLSLGVASLAGLAITGAAAPLQLADPGPIVRWGLPVVRGITDFSTAATIGALTMAVFATKAPSWQFTRLTNLAGLSAIAWTIFGLLTTVMTYLSVTGVGISASQSFGDGLWLFVTSIGLGQSLALNVLAGAAVSTLAFLVVGLRSALNPTVIAFAGLVPLAVSGHASSNTGHAMAVNSLGLHLVGVSVWVGGLIAAVALRSGDLESNILVSRRYSDLAGFAYLVIAVSGVAAASVRIYSFAELTTAYGRLVVAKSAILLGLGVLGAYYRRRILNRGALAKHFWGLVGFELSLMGVAMGLATALAHTAPPEHGVDLSNPTPAQILTGEKLPPDLTAIRWFTASKIDLIWLLVAVLGIALYLAGVRRLVKRGDKWSLPRTLSWVSGMLLLAWITCGPMGVYEQYLFSVHMIAHMMLTMAVPLLLVPGAPVTLLSRAVKTRTDGSRGLREWVLWAVHTPYAQFVANPYFAAINFASSLVVFYYTPLFGWATRDHLGHEWMVVHFLITGYLFVQSLVGIDPGPKPINYPVRLMIMLGTLTFHALFGLSLMMGNGLLLADWFGAMGRTWGQNPLQDQQTGGAIAWGIGEFPAAFLTLLVSVQWFKSDARDAKRLDRASDRSGGADIEQYNQMLAARAARREQAELQREAAFEASAQQKANDDRSYEGEQ
ncbi:MAG: cytochrome c oxidase assembly protein [Micrococcales bacterium]